MNNEFLLGAGAAAVLIGGGIAAILIVCVALINVWRKK